MNTPRAIDDNGSLLGDDLRALRAVAPPDIDLQAGLARLSAVIYHASPGVPPGSAAGTGGTAAGPGLVAALAGKKLALILIASVAVIGGAATGWVVWRPVQRQIQPERPQVRAAAPTTPPLAAQKEAAEQVAAPEVDPTTPHRVRPTRTAKSPVYRPKIAPETKPTEAAPEALPVAQRADDLLQEVRLIAKARAEIERNPAQALRLLEQARTDFPSGALVEDREALTVFARAGLPDVATAAAAARKFLSQFPSGPYGAKMRAIAESRLLSP